MIRAAVITLNAKLTDLQVLKIDSTHNLIIVEPAGAV